jgi:cytochrome P450
MDFSNTVAIIIERFLIENQTNRHAYAYIPFSAGKRNCVGQKFALMEEKVMLASILRKFKMIAMQKREELEEDFEIILRPHTGIMVKLEPRENNY